MHQLLHRGRLLAHRRLGAVKLEKKRRRLAQGGVAVTVDGTDRHGVEELAAGDRHAELNRLDHGPHRTRQGRKIADRRRHRLGHRIEPHRHLGDDAERALGAHHQPREVIAGRRFFGTPASADHLALRGHDGQAEHVLAHGAVAHRIGPGGASGRHAAERGVGARVDREKQAGVLDVFVELLAGHTGLHRAGEVFGIDRQHTIHLTQIDGQTALHRQQMSLER